MNEYRPDNVATYFIVIGFVVSTLRLYYNIEKQSGYINLVYTNPDYRGQKICQSNIDYMIQLTKKYIKKYDTPNKTNYNLFISRSIIL